MQIIEQLKDIIADLSNTAKVIVILAFLMAGLAYTFISKEEPAPEAAPTTVTKTVELGEVKANGDINGLQISQ